jgi:hypothetical protein
MINFNDIKLQFANIRDNLNSSLNQEISNQDTLNSIRQLKSSITNDYDALMNLPQGPKNEIMELYNNLNQLECSVYRYNELLKSGLTDEASVEAQVINQLTNNLNTNSQNNLTQKTTRKTINNTDNNIQEVLDFLQKHIKKVGTEQAVKDLQRGLNILNGYNKKSLIEAKRPIEEDGILGNQTYSCLENVCKYYSPIVLRKYIKRGAVNNAVFDTKNDRRIDTDKKVLNICNNLSKEETNAGR